MYICMYICVCVSNLMHYPLFCFSTLLQVSTRCDGSVFFLCGLVSEGHSSGGAIDWPHYHTYYQVGIHYLESSNISPCRVASNYLTD